MYLMNVPPIAAAQTEWRACGPPGGYSLPVCFTDSDPELPTRGPPISDKVQMIIESLRSTQSSLEMGDEIEGNMQSGQEGHSQTCKVGMGSYAVAKSKNPPESQQAVASSPLNHKSSDSDSDDSVDRGIEEAILEYLKEKDGHKRKAESSFNFLQSTKIPRKTSPDAEASNQNFDTNTFSIVSNQIPKSLKAETTTAPSAIPIKKYIKHKASLEDNTFKKFESDKRKQTASSVLPKQDPKSSNDSSSDDGIEEAIQRYQLEKKEEQNKRDAFNPQQFSEESDSSSDDGIEEAIRCYQLEQLKEKSALKPLLQKQKTFTKALLHAVGNTNTDNMKKRKQKKKKASAEKEVKSAQPPPATVFIPKNTLSESSKAKGNGLLQFKGEIFQEEPTPPPAPPKVNTTAELMCAEAILDISKTVMPGAFHQSVSLSSCATTESSLQSSLPDIGQAEESDGSSIDSEDGIEQEIRKFLEQKAQMHQQPPSSDKTQEPQSINEPEEVKAKEVPTPKKTHRLSLTFRRKNREANTSNLSRTDINVKETSSHPLPEYTTESSIRSQMRLAGLHETEPGGDKSSSLDSDEDLDDAIKDLLKTKKKSKKKTRDLKLKSRKCLKDEGTLPGNASQPKKFKHDPTSKHSALKKLQKGKDDLKDRSCLNKKTVLQHKQGGKSREQDTPEVETANLKGTEAKENLLSTKAALQIKEESSSVDSDDSIEEEIQRFLAEKAKGSTVEKSKDDVSRNGTDAICTPLQDEVKKQENQLAEIPRKSITPQSGLHPSSNQPLPTPQSSRTDLSSIVGLSQTPSLLEPADGAGAARTERRKLSTGKGYVKDVTTQTERGAKVLNPSDAHSRSEAIKWRQSFGLPTIESRTLSRTPFHVTSSRVSEGASASNQSGGSTPKTQTPVTGWSSAKSSRPHFPGSTETTVNTTFRSPVLNFLSTARQHPRVSFTQSLAPEHRPAFPNEGETKSMVHISKDKSVFVELESNRTNHVQVRSRERSEGKERVERKREGESMKIEDKDVHLERTEDKFVDEAECESDSRRNQEKKQGFPTLSLSRAIDPGITIRPVIALSTEERSSMFTRRYHAEQSNKVVSINVPVQKTAVQRVKRKLQFIPVSR